MSTTWKVNTDNTVTLDLSQHEVYAATGFTLKYKRHGEELTTSTAVFEEIIEIVSDVTLTINSNFDAGVTSITVDDSSSVEVGHLYKTGTQYFFVTSVSDNTLYIRRPLKNPIVAGETATRQGNTSIYEAILNLSDIGQYTIIISNTSIGLSNEVAKLEIINNTIDDISTQMNSNNVSTNTKLDTIASVVGACDVSMSGKLIV